MVSRTQILTPLERQGAIEHRQYYESRADDIRSGALEIKEKGPLEFRPSFEKRLH